VLRDKFAYCSRLKFLDFVSIIGSVGEGVTDVAPGDHVLYVLTGECKECAHYKSVESNIYKQQNTHILCYVYLNINRFCSNVSKGLFWSKWK
jgi:hypothetical protein